MNTINAVGSEPTTGLSQKVSFQQQRLQIFNISIIINLNFFSVEFRWISIKILLNFAAYLRTQCFPNHFTAASRKSKPVVKLNIKAAGDINFFYVFHFGVFWEKQEINYRVAKYSREWIMEPRKGNEDAYIK